MQDHVLPGAIRKIGIPNGWSQLPSMPDLGDYYERWERVFISLFDEGVQMIFIHRGMPVDEPSAQFMKNLLAVKSAKAAPEKLTPAEISGIQVVMGLETAGNNQYTNTGSKDDPSGPVFDLRSAETRNASGKTVLYIKGAFRSGNHYAGILFEADQNGRIIEEVILEAPSKKKLEKHLSDFDRMLANIEWNNHSDLN